MKDFITEEEKLFVEEGANLEHDRWARWYIYEKQNWSLENEARWDRQAKTIYSELPKQEKESDRKETRNYLPLLRAHDRRLIDYLLGKMPKEMSQYETVLVGREGNKYQWPIDNKSSNFALQQARKLLKKLLEDYKSE